MMRTILAFTTKYVKRVWGKDGVRIKSVDEEHVYDIVLNVLRRGRFIPHVRRRSVFEAIQMTESTSSVVLTQ